MKSEIKERIEKVRRGEVPEGYKQEIPYILPVDWSVERLANLTTRTSRRNRNKADIPACSINNQIGFVPQHEQFDGGSYINLDKTAYKVVHKGEFAYNPARINIGSIGRLNHAEEAITSSLYVCFKLSEKNNGVYFENWFKSYDFYKEVMRNLEGSVREYLFYENFSNIKMPIPPVPEQEKIAQILTQCDKVIQLKIQLIDEKRYQKKWLMQNLLNPESGLRLPGFEGSEWKEELFGEIFSFGSSLSASREQLGGKGICYLHYGDIHSNDSYYINVKASENKLPRLDVNRPADKFLLNDGDIVFVDASEDYDGASKYVVVSNPDRVPFISGLHTIPVRSKNTTMSNMFKRYCFQSYYIKKQFAFYATGMKVLGLNKENLRKITVKYPSLLEQTAIANMLSTADHEIGLIEQELVQWHKKKKSLMQLLLKGRVRVTV